jgi:CHAD domain-containing protein
MFIELFCLRSIIMKTDYPEREVYLAMDSANISLQSLQGIPGTMLSGGTTSKRKDADGIHKDDYEPAVKSSAKTGPRYPLMTEKLFGALDAMEKGARGLNEHPTNKQVSDSGVRNLSRQIQVLSEAYGDSYDEKELEKAQKPFHDLGWYAGQYKDGDLIEARCKALFPDGKLPLSMQREIGKMKEERAEEFHEFFEKFKNKKMNRALDVLRNPSPIKGEKSPAEISREDRGKLADEVGVLTDRIGDTGLFHKDPERLHDGRKSLRNLYALMYVTGDVFNYKKGDVDALFHLFTHYGEPQDTHIVQAWLEEKGFQKEAEGLLDQMSEEQRGAMEEATAFLDSGVLESIRETANR